jgi:hypothetical protein
VHHGLCDTHGTLLTGKRKAVRPPWTFEKIEMSRQQNDRGHVFISFTGGDKDVVVPIIKRLELQHLVVWTYLQNPGGARYPKVIEERIRTCSVFVLIVSLKAVDNDDVGKEVHIAHNYKRNIVPVVIDPAAQNAFAYQTADIVRIPLEKGSEDPNFTKLVESIKTYKPQLRPGSSKTPPGSIENLAWLRPHLVNRTTQEFVLGDYLRAVLDGRTGQPGFFLLHGREEECGDVFIVRVARDVVPNALEEVGRRGYVHPDQIVWPDHRDDIEDGNVAVDARYKALLYSAKSALDRARGKAALGAVFRLQLPIEGWRSEDLRLLEKLLSWWRSPHPDFPDRSPLVVIAYVSYGNGILGPRWRRWTLRRTHRIFEPRKSPLGGNNPQPVAALPILARISKVDAMNWADKHQTSLKTPDLAVAAQALTPHFQRRLGLGTRRISMEKAVVALRSLLADASASGAAI